MKTMKTFIHISDLHIAEMYRPGIEGKNKRTEKTWLIAQSDKDNHDYIAVFDEGRLSEYGTHAQLMKQKGLYHKMFTTQAEQYIK